MSKKKTVKKKTVKEKIKDGAAAVVKAVTPNQKMKTVRKLTPNGMIEVQVPDVRDFGRSSRKPEAEIDPNKVIRKK